MFSITRTFVANPENALAVKRLHTFNVVMQAVRFVAIGVATVFCVRVGIDAGPPNELYGRTFSLLIFCGQLIFMGAGYAIAQVLVLEFLLEGALRNYLKDGSILRLDVDIAEVTTRIDACGNDRLVTDEEKFALQSERNVAFEVFCNAS